MACTIVVIRVIVSVYGLEAVIVDSGSSLPEECLAAGAARKTRNEFYPDYE
jgi:hypothetical protein